MIRVHWTGPFFSTVTAVLWKTLLRKKVCAISFFHGVTHFATLAYHVSVTLHIYTYGKNTKTNFNQYEYDKFTVDFRNTLGSVKDKDMKFRFYFPAH